MSEEINFREHSIMNNDLPKDKQVILEAEMEKAMIKTASFRTSGNYQQPYPSPLLNLSDMEIPERMVELFRWCKYFYMFDPIIAGAINSLSTFPVTDVILTDISEYKNNQEDSEQMKLYKNILFDKIHIHKLLIEIGIDYWLYGNCFVFGEFETDPHSNKRVWKSLIRLDPSKISIDVNQATGEKKYKWILPDRIKKLVRNRKPIESYRKLPPMIIEAAKKNKAVLLSSNQIYHFSRPTDSLGESAWGTPVVANVLKLLMYRNVLRQAQEAIAREHIVPFRVYYLQSTNLDPSRDWNKAAETLSNMLKKAAIDPNYKVVAPVPVGSLNIGGQGRALLLTPEIEQIQSEILAGMNVPREFIFGGVSYSGTSISLKIVENQFITYRILLEDFIQNFVIKGMAKVNEEWTGPEDDDNLISAALKELKMQDDTQQKQLIINLNAAGKLTDDFLWQALGVDSSKMKESLLIEAQEKIKLETELQILKLESQFEVQKKQIEVQMNLQKYEMELQTSMGMVPNTAPTQQEDTQGVEETPQQEDDPQLDENQINEIVSNIAKMDENQAGQILNELPENIKQIVVQKLSQLKQQSSSQQPNVAKAIEAQKIAMSIMHTQDPQMQEVILSKLPQDILQMVMAYLEEYEALQPSELEDEEDGNQGTQHQQGSVDMRPLPQQRPPRRNTLG